MKKILLAVILIATIVGTALGQEPCCPPPDCPKPDVCCDEMVFVESTRLLSWGAVTAIVIRVNTPFEGGMYDIRWSVFNMKGKRVRQGGSMKWYTRPPGATDFAFEESMKLLQQDEYYVRAWVKRFAEPTKNER